MLPFKNFSIASMLSTRNASSKMLYCALLVWTLVSLTYAENKTPARILAKQTGATQFEEERFETHADCNDHKHHLKKRSSDEDVDYEVYQGVVGRPGIDFPIYPRIPRTTFSCRSFGNGYFADMDTDCQVFHICEEGRKISFLCPNGTIFQQSELTCDWWFKVNCLGSPGYYAESAEILNKQRVQRVRPSVPVKGFNIVGGGLNIKPKVSNTAPAAIAADGSAALLHPTQSNKSERRIDSIEDPGLESVDFDDLSGEKQLKGKKDKAVANIDDNSNDNNESQIAAESASFVNSKRRSSYTYEKPVAEAHRKPSNGRHGAAAAKRGNGDRSAQRNSYGGNESTENARSGQRGQQRFREDRKPSASQERTDSAEGRDASKKQALPVIAPKTLGPVVVPSKLNNGASSISAEADVKPEYYEGQSSVPRATERTKPITPAYPSGTYSTARRLDSTRTTPFYTPTIPSVSKSKAGPDAKVFYIKGKANAVTYAAVTPNTNRINSGDPSFDLTATATPKGAAVNTATTETPLSSSFRPFIIGMRHDHDTSSSPSSGEVHRFSLTSNNAFKIEPLPAQKVPRKTESRDYLPSSTPAPASTGPTYLPKSAASPKSVVNAGGDFLLFAPDPIKDESVTRNVDEMLKAVNLIKDKFEDVESIHGPPSSGRAGLEIPPSSGPDVLVSLAKYFAGEQNEADADIKSPNALSNDKFDKNRSPPSSTYATAPTLSSNQAPPVSKPSDTTASITTTSPAVVSSNSDDIKASLLSNRTVTRYTNLFGLQEPQGHKVRDINEGLLSHSNDTNGRSKQTESAVLFPQIGTTDASIRELAEKPESRKIAQVFSNALTTYLEDPKTFREQLAAVRPTEPPSVSGRPNFVPVTATDATLFKSGSAATYLPTRPTPAGDYTTTQANIAAEINNNFDYSTQHPELTSTTEVYDSTTTNRPSFGSGEQKLRNDFSSELLPPGQDSGEGEEFLQRQQTQSFVKSRNSLLSSQESGRRSSKLTTTTTTVTAEPTENPWNHISQSDFLDPLTINDGLMKEAKATTTTFSPFTSLPKDSSANTSRRSNGKVDILAADGQRGHLRVGSAEVTTQHSTSGAHSAETAAAEPDAWHDIFSSYDLPRDTLPSNSGLQRIANKLFGGLNETEALHLKNVMQQAEHNRQVLSLLLLLIQTCDDNNGKALERSRKHLLNALIDMDGKLQIGKDRVKDKTVATTTASSVSATTTRVPVTTFRRVGDSAYSSTTALPSTTTDLPTTAATSGEETTKFEIRVEDPEADFTSSGVVAVTPAATAAGSSSDKRALELLKSLYSLASKFTSRR